MKFIYLGESSLIPKNGSDLLEKEVLYELFQMAHMYQYNALMKCCINLITLICNKEDAEAIGCLVKRYEHAHLQQFYEYLVPEAERVVGFIKV